MGGEWEGRGGGGGGGGGGETRERRVPEMTIQGYSSYMYESNNSLKC